MSPQIKTVFNVTKVDIQNLSTKEKAVSPNVEPTAATCVAS